MAESTIAGPPPSNNDCPRHKEYNLTCGTCNRMTSQGTDSKLDTILTKFMNKACDYEGGLKVDLDKEFENAMQALRDLIATERKKAAIEELKELQIRTTPPKGYFGIVSGGQVQDYVDERLATLSQEDND